MFTRPEPVILRPGQTASPRVREAGGEAELTGPAEFSSARFSEFSAVTFDCPAMGSEVLEKEDFEPLFAGLEGSLGGKRVALFGSYVWGDGQWMRDWEDRMKAAGAELIGREGVICQETPRRRRSGGLPGSGPQTGRLVSSTENR